MGPAADRAAERTIHPERPNHIYSNTICKSDLRSGDTSCRGISIHATATPTGVQNNLVHLPNSVAAVEMIRDDGIDLFSGHNLMTDTICWKSLPLYR